MIGCPKLDAVDYSEKLTELFRRNDIRSVLVVRMQVPWLRRPDPWPLRRRSPPPAGISRCASSF